jgi:hypothetical protein
MTGTHKIRIRAEKNKAKEKCFETCSEKSLYLGVLSKATTFSILRVCIELIK